MRFAFPPYGPIYCAMCPKQELGEIYVPKRELGNEGKSCGAGLHARVD